VRLGVAAHAVATPHKRAIVWGDHHLTFEQYDARVNQVVRMLQELGVSPSDAVAVSFGNRPQFYEAAEALGRIGASMVPVSWRFKTDEVSYMLADSGAKLLLSEPNCEAVIGDVQVLSLDQYEAGLKTQAASALAGTPSLVSASVVAYTSGTTGRPRAIIRPPSSIVDATEAATQQLGFLSAWGVDNPAEVHLCCAPLYHSQPRVFSLQALTVGQSVVLMERFDAEEVLRLIEQERVTWTSMAPVHFVRILALPEEARRKYDLSSLRVVVHSAAPCPVDVKRAIMDVVPPNTVWELYGGTEGLFTMISPAEWLRKPGSVGRPGPNVGIKILDEELDPVGPGEIGTVYATSPGPRFSYRGADQTTEETWLGDYFTLGEMGYLDDDGFLFLADRRKDMIITGGSNVYSAEVEAVLISHPSVADVAVIGVPDPEFGEQVKALVEPREPIEAEALIAYCREHLAHFKCPKSIDFLPSMPRDPNGKVRKRELREPYWAGRERRI
jgi:long-chain acyl-CoA synthetase